MLIEKEATKPIRNLKNQFPQFISFRISKVARHSRYGDQPVHSPTDRNAEERESTLADLHILT